MLAAAPFPGSALRPVPSLTQRAPAVRVTIRPAVPADLEALVALEERSFPSDRISRRAFRYLLSRANAAMLVAVDAAAGSGVAEEAPPLGYVLVLFNRGTSLARVYSIAVEEAARGQGVGKALLVAAEAVARQRDAAYMRLEVRADALATQAFYRAHGYRRFRLQPHYYEDDVAAVRMEKPLAPSPDPALVRVPYYAQSLDFTCGPAALLMAMRALDPQVTADVRAEVRLWRESTTVFMTSGLGGCSPEGLALAATRRGFAASVCLSDRGVLFLESVRSPTKRGVISLVQEDFREECRRRGIPIAFRPLSIEMLRDRFSEGDIPIVLISSYRFASEKQPHWVVVTGFDDHYVYLNDPNVAEHLHKTATDCMQIPVRFAHFIRMARYGKAQQQAALFIGRRAAAAMPPATVAAPVGSAG